MKVLIGLISILFVYGCTPKHSMVDVMLCDSTISADEVLKRLDSVVHIERLNKYDKSWYRYLKAKAHYDLGRVRKKDTLLKEEIPFFYKNGRKREMTYLYLCIGRAYEKAKEADVAMINYLEAKEIAVDLHDDVLLFHALYELGDLCYKSNDDEGALKQFHEMMALYETHQELRSKVEINSLLLRMGDCLLCLGRYENALEVFDQAIASVRQSADSVTLANMLFKMAYSFERIEKFQEAKTNIRQALRIIDEKQIHLQGLLLLSRIYLFEKQADSLSDCLCRAKRLLEPSDLESKESYYFLLSQLCELKGEYQQALFYFKQYDAITDTTYVKKMRVRMDRLEEMQKRLKWQKRYLYLHNRYLLIVLIGVLLVGVLGGSIFFLQRRAYKRKRRCIEAEDFIEKLNVILNINKSKLEDMLSHNLYIARTLSRLKSLPHEKNVQQIRNFNEIFYNGKAPNELDWEEIYFTINFLYDDFKDKLVNHFPLLNEKEIQLCCLLRAGFDTSDCAFMAEQSIYSIQKRKTTIRKKLGIEQAGNIIDFLSNSLY